MTKDNKVYLKLFILIACSLGGVTNLIAMFVISKKTKNKTLRILSWVMLICLIVSCILTLATGSSSALSTIATLGMCISVLAPSFFSLFNLGNYKRAYEIEATLKEKNINTDILSDNEQEINNSWVTDKQIKMAKQMYGNKGIAVLNEIDSQIVNEKENERKRLAEIAEREERERIRKIDEEKRKQEAEKAERERKVKEQREFELAKINAEKEKAEAEARALKMKREKEQEEFELARIKAEKEKAEAEAKILKMKKEDSSRKPLPEEKPLPKREKSDKYVFISYSTKDGDIAAKTKEILENNDINCWIAPWSIPAGSDYASEIPKALNGCSAMVLLLSKASQESKWVPKEVGLAIENNKIIIPFQIDNELITDSFNFYLTNSQRISAYNRMNDAYNELTQSIYRLLEMN